MRGQHIWILQTGEPLPIDSGARPMRASSLAEALVAQGHRVTIWSADFNHTTHQHRYGRRTRVRLNDQLEVRLLDTRGYSGNLTPARLLDHAELALELRRVLRNESSPDVAFLGFPPIEPATYLAQWLSDRQVPFMVDVKDAWPDIFERAFPAPMRPLGRYAVAPYSWLARRCFRQATGISSISNEFLDWVLHRAGRGRRASDLVVPLTAPQQSPDPDELAEAGRYWDQQGVRADGTFRVMFVGTLHSSYDFTPVASAAAATDAQFVVCGDGSAAPHIRQAMAAWPNVVMPGWVSAAQAEALAQRSSVAIAPIAPHPDYVISVPNKFYDAMSKGLPMLTGLPGSAQRFVREFGVGEFYGDPAGPDLTDVIQRLSTHPADVRAMSERALATYHQQFDHSKVYGHLASHLAALGAGARPHQTLHQAPNNEYRHSSESAS